MAWHDILAYTVDKVLGFQSLNKHRENEIYLKDGIADGSLIDGSAIDKDHLETGVGTSSGTITYGPLGYVHLDLQEISFFPNFYAAEGAGVVVGCHDTGESSEDMRLGLNNISGSDSAYTIRWCYVTATDEPFIYAIRDKTTGEIEHLWMCEDPPPRYWGLDDKPDDFKPPISTGGGMSGKDDITIFKYPRNEYKEISDRAKKDKKKEHEVLNDTFEYNKDKKLFTSKNLAEI